MTLRAFSLLAVSSALALAGCGGKSSSSTSSDSGVYLMVSDAPSDDLSAFEVTITGLFLQEAGGAEGGNLIAATHTVNLLDLATRSALLDVTATPGGTFDGVRLTFDGTSIRARDLAGTLVPVTATSTSALAVLTPPLVLTGGVASKVHLELPLADTLVDDPLQPGALLFTPTLAMIARHGVDEPLDELHGVVLAENQAGHLVLIRFFDRETGIVQSDLVVAIGSTTALLDDDGDPFLTEGAFFGSIGFADDVDMRSHLAPDGLLEADVIQIEEDGRFDVTRIRGTIADLDVARELVALRVRTIDFGREIVEPALAALGDPAEIIVDFGNAKIRVGGDDPRSGNDGDLAIGQTVQVEFATFPGQPFPAREIEIEDEQAEFQGTIVDDGAIPNAFVVHLEPQDPAVLEGLVASATTDVDVLLDGFERTFLHLRGEPTIQATRLFTDLRVRLHGDLSGPPTAPHIAAADMRVDAGRLRGTVTAINRSLGTFTVDVDQVDAPFGGAQLPDPVVIRFEAGALVEGDANSTTEFFDRFGNLGPGETLVVELDGLADGLGGAGAWIVDATVEG